MDEIKESGVGLCGPDEIGTQKNPRLVGKVKGLKSIEDKHKQTVILSSELTSSDVYVTVRKIVVPIEKMTRLGTNGVNVSDEYFPSKESKISPERIAELFKKCDSFIFNMSNQDQQKPKTCQACLGDEISFFINMKDTTQLFSLCEDQTTLKIGNTSAVIVGDSLDYLILLASSLFTGYSNSEINEIPLSFFKKDIFLKKEKIIKSILNWFLGEPSSTFLNFPEQITVEELDDYFVDDYFRKNKKMDIRNIYP